MTYAVDISRDGAHVATAFGETETEANAAFLRLLRLQGQSVDYATKHGGWRLTAPYKAALRYVIGTAHFSSKRAADDYYAAQHHTPQDVARKIEAGEIHIGPPMLKPGEDSAIDRQEGRYFVRVFDRVEGDQ